MKKRQKTEINLQVEESIFIRTRKVLCVRCYQCRRETRMMAANEAAMIARISEREIHGLVNSGRIHFTEDSFGLLYVCSESLRELLSNELENPAKKAGTKEV